MRLEIRAWAKSFAGEEREERVARGLGTRISAGPMAGSWRSRSGYGVSVGWASTAE